MANTKVTGDLIASGTITADNLVSGTLDTLLNSYLTTNTYATQGYVTTAVNNLIDAAPSSLDTLNELAAALNDDANFATTVTNSLATKLNLSGGNITGTLGIGTASVLSGNKLDVRGGNIMVGGYGTGVDYGLIFTPADSSSYWHIYNDTSGALAFGRHATIGSSEHLRINSSGSIGIGTAAPRSKLDVNGIITQEYGNVYQVKQGATEKYYYSNGASYNAFGTGVLGIGTTGDAIQFATSNSVRATINSSGNIGIGTTSPSEKLTVNGNINFPFSTSGVAYFGIEPSPTNPFATNAKELVIRGANAYTAGTPTQAQAGGDVYIKAGLGVVNTGLGVYAGDVSIEGGETHDASSAGAGKVIIKTSGSERLRVDQYGNVGIGTTSPNATLHVNGGAHFGPDSGVLNPSTGQVLIETASGATPILQFYPYGSSVMFLKSDGTTGVLGWNSGADREININNEGAGAILVGIGTGAPVNTLDVNGTIRSTGGISTDNSAKSYAWTLHNTGNSGTVWRRIARFTASQSDRIKIVLTGEPGYSNGASYGSMATILAQYNNANNLQGRFSREGSNQPIYGVNFEQISGTDYYINVQVGSYSEFAIEAVISGGTLTPITASSTAGISANVAEEKRIHSPTYFLNNKVGINTTAPHSDLHVEGDISQTSNSKTIVFSKTLSDNVGTDIAGFTGFTGDPSAATILVTVVVSASAGYAVQTHRYLWNLRKATAGRSRSVTTLTGSDQGSVNSGVVNIVSVTPVALYNSYERFRLSVNVSGISESIVYVKMEAIGENIRGLNPM